MKVKVWYQVCPLDGFNWVFLLLGVKSPFRYHLQVLVKLIYATYEATNDATNDAIYDATYEATNEAMWTANAFCQPFANKITVTKSSESLIRKMNFTLRYISNVKQKFYKHIWAAIYILPLDALMQSILKACDLRRNWPRIYEELMRVSHKYPFYEM